MIVQILERTKLQTWLDKFGIKVSNSTLNSNPDTNDDVKLFGWVCHNKELCNDHGNAQEVDVLLQPYQSQHPSSTDIGCHLQLEEDLKKWSPLDYITKCALTWRCHNMLIARGIPKARLEMRIDEMAIFGAGNKFYSSNTIGIKVNQS